MESIYEDKSIKSQDFSKQIFTKYRFTHVSFENCNFASSKWTSSQFMDCTFKDCNLSLTHLEGCRLQDIVFAGSKLVGIEFYKCDPKLFKISFQNSILIGCNFTDMTLKRMSFKKSFIRDSYFSHTDLSGADFFGTDLQGSLFHQCNLTKTDFRQAVNYSFDLKTNTLNQAKFSMPEALSLLKCLNIDIC